MRYKKELAALQEYISNFNPEEFTSSAEYHPPSVPTQVQLISIQKLKSRLRRKRQILESFQCLLERDLNKTGEILSQKEVDALLEGWTAPKQCKDE